MAQKTYDAVIKSRVCGDAVERETLRQRRVHLLQLKKSIIALGHAIVRLRTFSIACG